MNKSRKISEAEWQVCQELWRLSPQTANELAQILAADNGWSPRTVRTLINRLVGKGTLGYESLGREYRYFPLVSKEECIAEYTQSFVDRVFDGAAGAIVAAFIKQRRLSDLEIAELKAILDDDSPGGSARKRGKPPSKP